MADGRSDGELVAAAVNGSQEAFGELMARHHGAVLQVARHRLQDVEEAQDAAQETFVKAYLNLSTLREPGAFGAWLHRIAEGTALDSARRPRREVPLDGGDLSVVPPTAEDGSPRRLALNQAIRKLSELDRRVIVLHYSHGCSIAEIARATRTSVGAVKTRLDRARDQLLREMVTMAEGRLRDTTLVYVCRISLPGAGSSEAVGACGEASPMRRLVLAQFAFDGAGGAPEIARKLGWKRNRVESAANSAALYTADAIANGADRLRALVPAARKTGDRPGMVVRCTIRGKEHECWSMTVRWPYRALRGFFASLLGMSGGSRAQGGGRFVFREGDTAYPCQAALTEDTVEVTIGKPLRRLPSDIPIVEWRDNTPRMVSLILDQAVRQESKAARVALTHRGSRIEVDLLKNREWSSLMRFEALVKLRSRPPEQRGTPIEQPVWAPLRERLAKMAGLSPADDERRRRGSIRFRSGGKEHEIRAVFSPGRVRLSPVV